MDGLKTGFTRSSGFNLAATTERNGRRIVTIVLGGRTRFSRDDFVELLTESAFKELGTGVNLVADQATPYEFSFQDPRDGADAEALAVEVAAVAEEQIRLQEARAQAVRLANEKRAADRIAADARAKATAERDE
eukprot:gene23151-23163_t